MLSYIPGFGGGEESAGGKSWGWGSASDWEDGDEEGMAWFDTREATARPGGTRNLKDLLQPNPNGSFGIGIKIAIPPGRQEILAERLSLVGQLPRPVEQDSSSLFRALAFALGRKRDVSHLNIRNEIVDFLSKADTWPVLDSDVFKKKCEANGDVQTEKKMMENSLSSRFQKVSTSKPPGQYSFSNGNRSETRLTS